MTPNPKFWAVACLCLALGCASTKPSAARAKVDDMLEGRAGIEGALAEDPTALDLAAVTARVDELLARPLDEGRAARIALINNRSFLATLEDLGVAQADLVEAGLLDNPVISGDLVFSTRGNGIGGGLSLAQSLLSVFLIPAKRRVARAKLERTILVVGDAALMLVRDTRIAYAYDEAARSSYELHRQIAQVAEVADELAARQAQAGNMTPLERELVGAELDEVRLELLDSELELAAAHEQLNQLLGLWGEQIAWRPAPPRAELPEPEAELGALVERGIAERLDLSAARFHVSAIEYALKLRRRGLVPQVEVGVEARNEVGDDVGHEWVVGPSLSIELPLFNPGHADLARLRAQLRQAQHELADRAIGARSEIRLGRETLIAARRRVDYYRETVLPRQDAIYQHSLELYNAMGLGAYELFETRHAQLEEQIDYVEARRSYWIARAQLEFAIGGRLS